jgi:hypothetical protein
VAGHAVTACVEPALSLSVLTPADARLAFVQRRDGDGWEGSLPVGLTIASTALTRCFSELEDPGRPVDLVSSPSRSTDPRRVPHRHHLSPLAPADQSAARRARLSRMEGEVPNTVAVACRRWSPMSLSASFDTVIGGPGPHGPGFHHEPSFGEAMASVRNVAHLPSCAVLYSMTDPDDRAVYGGGHTHGCRNGAEERLSLARVGSGHRTRRRGLATLEILPTGLMIGAGANSLMPSQAK